MLLSAHCDGISGVNQFQFQAPLGEVGTLRFSATADCMNGNSR